ncbi:MAG TPA: 4'-phosphopantetheinyl transferase superfamily protein [Candidatus Binatia bacterium]|nr:4'-phosphopantetheinyl transferase superfamily protein [Candidatus Binatia bacterium]
MRLRPKHINVTDAQSALDGWLLPPDIIELNDNELHVWQIKVDPKGSDDESLTALLSPDERQRAKQFRFDQDRKLYTAAHAAMRSLLARYLRLPGGEIHLVSGAQGKPVIARPIGSRLQFNLSHSHELALLAVAPGRAVGVDVELIRDFEFREVAESFFTAKEVANISALPHAVQREAFYKCWTSKEAFLKAKGTGLSGKLDEVELLGTTEGLVKIAASVLGWSLLDLPQVSGYAAAAVIAGAPLPVRCYRWEGALAR